MDLNEVRQFLADRMATIDGLRTFAYVPNSLQPPAAYVDFPVSVTYHNARALNEFVFPVFVCVARSDDREAQRNLGEYLSPEGPRSIPAALEGDQSLYAVVCREIQTAAASDTKYFGTFIVEVTG